MRRRTHPSPHEELFRLNLNYLLFAQRLMAQDAHQAAIQTRTQQVHAGLFAALYERRAGAGMLRQLDVRAVMAAHDLYRLLRMPEAQLDFNGAWVIARYLRVGTAELRSCRSCKSAIWSPAAAAWRRPARSAPCTPGGPDLPSPALSCQPGSRSRQATGTRPFC